MTSIDDLVSHIYGNGSGEEKELEPHVTNNIGTGKDKKKKKAKDNQDLEVQKAKRQHIAYKFSNKGRGILHEAVIISGQPAFLIYEGGQFKTVQQIEEPSRIIKPPYQEEYPYEPYEFANIEEVKEYAERAKLISIGSIYTQTKQFVADYNDQDACKLNLLSLDIIFSYFQDKFSTTHYEGIVGDNDSGKSSLGLSFGAIGYRPVYMTDPSAANIFRCLGTIEHGQCTIILDEADKIDKSPEMMAILKTGYQLSGKVPKINSNTLRQEFFQTYSLKIIISEKSMSLIEAKGVHDRTFSYTAYPGDSTFDIKETLNPQGDTECQKRLSELSSFRKLLVIYRLLHFKDPVTNIDTGLKRRNRELVKPILQLFSDADSKVKKEISFTLEGFLKTKQTRKENTIEAALCPIATNLVSHHGKEIPAKYVWDEIVGGSLISGYYDEKRPNEFQSADYATLYRNTITNIICDKLGAQKKHKEIGSVLIFDIDKLAKIAKSYDLNTHIQMKLPDGSDSSDDFSKATLTSKENGSIEPTNNSLNSTNISKESAINIVNNTNENSEINSVTPIKPSEPSEPSGQVIKGYPTTIAKHEQYWIQSVGLWGCKHCSLRADRFGMQNTPCSRKNMK